jgi:transposase
MPTPKAKKIILSKRTEKILTVIINKRNNPTYLVTRSKIILFANKLLTNSAISNVLNIDINTVQLWRNRWAKKEGKLYYIEKENVSDKELLNEIILILSDKPRSGKPKKFSSEQKAQIISLACQNPKKLNLPFSHWTISELVKESINRGIVDSISNTRVQNFLKSKRNKTTSDEILA